MHQSKSLSQSHPVVAHAVQCYLGLSETFIYSVLRNLQDIRPVVVTESTENLDAFPFEPVYTTSSIKRFSWWWLVNGLRYRLGNRDEFFEHMMYMRHVIRKQDARVIHAHFGPMGVKMLPIKRQMGIPLVTTFYGYDMSELPRQPEWRDAYARLFSEGDLFLVEGPHMRMQLARLGCPEHRIQIQHIGVDIPHLQFRERHLDPGQKAIVLFCGRFTEKKGLIYALQAVVQVVQRHPNLEFRIIGDGEDRPSLEQFISEHNLEHTVRLLGFQPHHVFIEQLADAHIFIQPSVTASNGDTEGGAPTVLLEAQACGVPILATRHADIPEVVRDGESGILVPERDADALAEQLFALLEHSGGWPQMGQRGRQHIETEHDIRTLAADLEQRYDRLIEEV